MKLTFCTILLFCSILFIKAEENTSCANEQFQHLLFTDAFYKNAFEAVNRSIENNSTSGRIQDAIWEIPVVVHVLHLGEPVGTGTNISDEQIIDAIRGANERWRRATTTEGVDMEVQFCLAQFDPEGNPSTGIIRKDASGIPNYSQYGISYVGALGQPGSDEVVTKNFSNWRHDYVYNIWVVNKIAGGWGGYAFFPFGFNYPTDGTVIISTAIRYNSATLAHELGHGMGLFHTFQGSENGCPVNGICALAGDWVCDTPPHRQTDCTSSPCHNSPDGNNSYRNIMSYCSNRVLFTAGQKKRSRDIINSTSRAALLNSTACSGIPCIASAAEITTTTCNAAEAGTFLDTLVNIAGCDSIVTTIRQLIPPPEANFSFVLTGNTVTFNNTSEHALQYVWNFGDDSVSNEINPTHQYAAPGNYVVTLTAENNCTTSVYQETINVSFTTSIRENKAFPLQFFPNPGNGNFSIRINNSILPQHSFLQFFNLLGQPIYNYRITTDSEQYLNLSSILPAGIYQVQLIIYGENSGNFKLSVVK